MVQSPHTSGISHLLRGLNSGLDAEGEGLEDAQECGESISNSNSNVNADTTDGDDNAVDKEKTVISSWMTRKTTRNE